MRIGIDLGGTYIVAGVVDGAGKIVARMKTPTLPARGPADVVGDMVRTAREAAGNAGISRDDIESVGIGSPGSVDSAAGVITFSGNLGFKLLPLARMFREGWDVPVSIGNDANAAALGEYHFGAGKDFRSLIMVTLGTGVGGGIVFDGRIHEGFNGAAGEIGHMVISKDGAPCTCGRLGCFESYSSATALVRMTKEEMESNPDGGLERFYAEKVNGRTAFDAARRGNASGERVVKEYISYLACGIGNLVNLFQPEVLCIGGGVSGEGEYLLDRLRPAAVREFFDTADRLCELRMAELGNDAGIVGAAMLGGT